MNQKTTPNASSYYDQDYFDWQKNVGAFGGIANSFKFTNSYKPTDTVLDFGCGGGFLLANLDCQRKIGIEPNNSAADSIKNSGAEHYFDSSKCMQSIGAESVDTIISNHALEHTLNPLEELQDLYKLLKPGGIIHFFIPLDSIKYSYDADDINYHLYSWSPQNLGNLFVEAGFTIIHSRPYHHKWPPYYQHIARLGWPVFHLACKVYARLERKWFQVEIIAKK
ncbi:class I SAM-dependent methyltransferase [Gammaproteobacteria bacterium]|nr:class I SAM-dependent methyltransferase [Gammaproteobacteria bacterium]